MENKYIDMYINNVKLPTPSTIELEYSDLDADSIRPITTGKLKRNRIRADIQKVKIGYLLNDVSELDSIMNMIRPATFMVRLYDNAYGKVMEKEMYTGNKAFAYIRVSRDVKGQGFKFSIIET